MATEQRQLMDTGLDDLNDINVTSLVGYRDSLLQQQTLKQSNGQNIDPSNIVSSTKSSSSSSQHLILVTNSTTNDHQHQEKSKTSKKKVIKKPFYKCEWDFCEKVFVNWKDLRTHVLDVHVDGFDEEDGRSSGKVSVETKADEQANPMNQDEIVEIDDQSSHISHNHESTTNAKSLKSSQQLLKVDSDSNKELMDKTVLEDDTDLDEQPMDHSDSTDSDDKKLPRSENQQQHPELNKSTNESKLMNLKVMILKPFRCWYCDDSFEKVDCLKKHFEAFHSNNTGEESESDSNDHLFLEVNLNGNDTDVTYSDGTDSDETDLNNANLDEHSKSEVLFDGTDSDEESFEETISNEKNIFSQQIETKRQTLNKSISDIDDQDCVDYLAAIKTDDYCDSDKCDHHDGDVDGGVISVNQQLQCTIIDDVELNGSNIDGHQQEQLVHPVTELNQSTNQSSFNCPECGQSFIKKYLVNWHLRQVHPSLMFCCGVSGCGKWCKTIDHMLSHYIHSKAHKKVNIPCDQCKKFGRDKHLKAHLETDHSICFNPQQPRHQNTEISKLTNPLVNCPECPNSYKSQKLLDTHLRQVHTKQMFYCEVSGCGKWCKRVDHMLSHYIHSKAHKKVNIPCDQCKKLGKNKHLKAHLETDHTICFDPRQTKLTKLGKILITSKAPVD